MKSCKHSAWQSSTKLPVLKSVKNTYVTSGGSRGGARPLIFRPNWGPKHPPFSKGLELVGDFRRCYIALCWDFLRKEKGKYTVTLINRSYLIFPLIQHKVVLLVLRSVFAVSFWLLNFLQLKLWARIPLQIGDGPSAVVLYLYFNFHNIIVLLLYFKV